MLLILFIVNRAATSYFRTSTIENDLQFLSFQEFLFVLDDIFEHLPEALILPQFRYCIVWPLR